MMAIKTRFRQLARRHSLVLSSPLLYFEFAITQP
jgi:hypothetical protein